MSQVIVLDTHIWIWFITQEFDRWLIFSVFGTRYIFDEVDANILSQYCSVKLEIARSGRIEN